MDRRLVAWLLAGALSACALGDEESELSQGAADGTYGMTTVPPTIALADTFYDYDLRTTIGACATDRVEWTYRAGPEGSALELPRSGARILPGASHLHESGGPDRESGRVRWDLGSVGPGVHRFVVAWRAFRDCGPGGGAWGPEAVQEWSLEIRDNRWYSGDLHVHTKHSERGEESGGARDYYRRMTNAAADDAGRTFGDRVRHSLRGRLHWLVFTDHTNNEHAECGRHFPRSCGDDADGATGRDVAKRLTEESNGSALLVVGSEISNKTGGHLGFLPLNPYPGHRIYAPHYESNPTDYDRDFGFGPGIFRERWVDPTATSQREIDDIHAMGGLAMVNHEDGFVGNWVKYDWTSVDFDGLEVWNGAAGHDKWDDSAYNGGINLSAVAKGNRLTSELSPERLRKSWVGMLKHGRWPFALVGGSDVHSYREVACGGAACDPTNAELGAPMTTVWADSFVWANGQNGVVDGLRTGRVVVHDASNFIDLRITYEGREYMVGDTIDGYVPGSVLSLRAFGHASHYVDGDNRTLMMLGTNMDATDASVRVLYSSEDEEHFVPKRLGKDHMRYIRPGASFDRSWEVRLDERSLGAGRTYFVWSQFIPWHNPLYFYGNGRDMALTGAIRVKAR
jgi:hypothetical protein